MKSVNFNKFSDVLQGKRPNDSAWKHFFSKRYVLQWGSMADPFCLFERKNRVGEKLIKLFGDLNYPVKLCFKGDCLDEYMRLFDQYKQQLNFAFQSSIITTDENLSKYIEMGAPSPEKRLYYLKTLSEMGYWTIMRLRPFIIGMSDVTLDDLLNKILVNKIRAVSVEFFCLDIRANANIKERYKWISNVLGYDIVKYYKDLSPHWRGGYLRLNRDVKERYIRKIYKFCVDNNILFSCSDPDFKELNMSGSCCGLPEVFTGNSEITNFCKCQLTNAIRLLRKKYWSGEKAILSLDWLYSLDNTFGSYYDDYDFFSQDCIEKIGLSAGRSSQYNMRVAMRKHFNNLNSPKCPMNYFDGKFIPVGRDKNEDLMFEYNPSDYEYMWKEKYGIKL